MSKQFQPEYSPEQRFQMLKDNCEKQEETTYSRDLSQEELDVKHEMLGLNLIETQKLEEELEKVKAEFKGQINPLKADCKIILGCIRSRKEDVKGILFHMANHEEGMMEVYDESGEMISSRRLRPDEKQLKAFPLRKAGEN